MLNKVLIFTLKLVIILVLITFISSSILVEVEQVIKNTFANIFEHASPESKKRAVDKFEGICTSSDDENRTVILGVQLCKDPNLRQELEENCAKYEEFKIKNEVEEDKDFEETCDNIERTKFDKYCEKTKNTFLAPDLKGMERACEEYNEGKIDGKELFVNYIGSAVGNIEISNSNIFARYKKIVQFFETYSTLYVFVLLFFLWLLYLLIKDLSLVFTVLSRILFNISLFLLLPYFVISSYVDNVGIQTDVLLNLFSEGSVPLQANIILGLLLIALLSFYNKTLLTRAIIFFIIGTIGKLHRYMMRKKKVTSTQTPKTKAEEIKEKELNKIKVNNLPEK